MPNNDFNRLVLVCYVLGFIYVFLKFIRIYICFFENFLLMYTFLKVYRTYGWFMNLCLLRHIVVVFVKRFDIYIKVTLCMFRFIIFDYIF